ncbi:MAG: hypothetical protein ACE5K7_04880 [Phycisphaerae bacterium]
MGARFVREGGLIGVVGLVAVLAGCSSGVISDSLNPQFMEVLGTPFAPVAPGTKPFLVLRVVNMTPLRALMTLSWQLSEDPATVGNFQFNLDSDTDSAVVLSCPVARATLGDVQNRDATGALIILDDNTRQEVPALKKILLNGVDYFCGDVIIFVLMQDPSTVGGYSVIYGVVDGSTQPTEFAGPDTFGLLEREIGELMAIGINPFTEVSGP